MEASCPPPPPTTPHSHSHTHTLSTKKRLQVADTLLFHWAEQPLHLRYNKMLVVYSELHGFTAQLMDENAPRCGVLKAEHISMPRAWVVMYQ